MFTCLFVYNAAASLFHWNIAAYLFRHLLISSGSSATDGRSLPDKHVIVWQGVIIRLFCVAFKVLGSRTI